MANPRDALITGIGLVSCLGNDRASVGASLRESTAGMRATQYEVRNVVDAPGRYQRMVAAAAPPRISTNPNMPLNTGNQLPTTWTKPTTNGGNGAWTRSN